MKQRCSKNIFKIKTTEKCSTHLTETTGIWSLFINSAIKNSSVSTKQCQQILSFYSYSWDHFQDCGVIQKYMNISVTFKHYTYASGMKRLKEQFGRSNSNRQLLCCLLWPQSPLKLPLLHCRADSEAKSPTANGVYTPQAFIMQIPAFTIIN